MLHRAAANLGPVSTLRLGSCVALPVQNATADLVLASFVLSYIENIEVFARELHRVARPGATVYLSDVHPETTVSCNWTRSFKVNGTEEHLHTVGHSLQQVIDIFQICGFELLIRIEPCFGSQ